MRQIAYPRFDHGHEVNSLFFVAGGMLPIHNTGPRVELIDLGNDTIVEPFLRVPRSDRLWLTLYRDVPKATSPQGFTLNLYSTESSNNPLAVEPIRINGSPPEAPDIWYPKNGEQIGTSAWPYGSKSPNSPVLCAKFLYNGSSEKSGSVIYQDTAYWVVEFTGLDVDSDSDLWVSANSTCSFGAGTDIETNIEVVL